MARVYEVSCPKCGSTATKLRYCFLPDGWTRRPDELHLDDLCQGGEPEHFHRNCETCGYRWVTHDVIGPQDEVPAPWADMEVISVVGNWWCRLCRVGTGEIQADAPLLLKQIRDHMDHCHR